MPRPYPGGRHELGQNLLVDRSVIATVERLVACTTGPIVEVGPGDGALTVPLSKSGRPITAVEIDPRRAQRTRSRTPGHVTVRTEDILHFRFPRHDHVIVGNLPFHATTPIMRRILAVPHWQDAVLLVQWEVGRRRAGVGGASMLTACWWPWYEFAMHTRVPARSFRPVPSADGGLLTMSRRATPLVAERKRYQGFVKEVFTGPGRGLHEILPRTGRISRKALRGWIQDHEVPPRTLPKDLTATQWASLWSLTASMEPASPQRGVPADSSNGTPSRKRSPPRTRR